MSKCVFCQHEIEMKEAIGRRTQCPFCEKDLHSCLQCASYDELASRQCREPNAERVDDKESGNFCDFFRFGRDAFEARQRKEDSLKKLQELFKK